MRAMPKNTLYEVLEGKTGWERAPQRGRKAWKEGSRLRDKNEHIPQLTLLPGARKVRQDPCSAEHQGSLSHGWGRELLPVPWG